MRTASAVVFLGRRRNKTVGRATRESRAADIRRLDEAVSSPTGCEDMVYGCDKVELSRLSGGLKAMAFIMRSQEK